MGALGQFNYRLQSLGDPGSGFGANDRRGARTYNEIWDRTPAWCRADPGQGSGSWKLFCICTIWGVGQFVLKSADFRTNWPTRQIVCVKSSDVWPLDPLWQFNAVKRLSVYGVEKRPGDSSRLWNFVFRLEFNVTFSYLALLMHLLITALWLVRAYTQSS